MCAHYLVELELAAKNRDEELDRLREENERLRSAIESWKEEEADWTEIDKQRYETIKKLEAVAEAAKRVRDRGYPCQCCDKGYDDEYCTCWEEIARDKSNLKGLFQALAALDATREEK
jgi:hypothetical protein